MRRFTIAILAVAAGSLAIAGSAQAAYSLQGQRLATEFSTPPLDRKVPGPVNSLVVDVITDYAGTTGPVDKRATRTKVYFPKDGRINTAGIPQCDPATPGLSNSTSDVAMSLCGPALVGSGSATLVGPVAGQSAQILLFNGTQPNGAPTLLFHGRTTANTTTLLTGTIGPSDLPEYGLVLDVPIPSLPLGLAISDFKTTVNKIALPAAGRSAAVSAKGKKKPKKKKKRPPQFFLMATCSTGSVTFQAVTTYDGGGAPTTATSTNTCVQKKSKKKKKKRKKK
jgi:hypothetical protein